MTKEVKYVGSSAMALDKLEDNHRNASKKKDFKTGEPYKLTRFRKALVEEHVDEGEFFGLAKPELRTEKEVLELEEEFQRKYRPRYNQDYTPLLTKLRYGKVLDDTKKYRGVYGFEV